MKGSLVVTVSSGEYEKASTEEDRSLLLKNLADAGVKVRKPLEDEVFVDIDTDSDYEEFLHRASKMEDFTGLRFKYEEYPSKSGLPHRHIIVTISGYKIMSELERIAFQFVFNSDPTREFLNVGRYLKGDTPINMLFDYREVKK